MADSVAIEGRAFANDDECDMLRYLFGFVGIILFVFEGETDSLIQLASEFDDEAVDCDGRARLATSATQTKLFKLSIQTIPTG